MNNDELEVRAAQAWEKQSPQRLDTQSLEARLAELAAESQARALRLLEVCQVGPPENCSGNLCAGEVEFEDYLLPCPLDRNGCPFGEGRARREQERILASLGFGVRYWHPELERVAADIRADIQTYLANLGGHIQRGENLIVSGAPGTGKSSLLALLALHAHRAGYRVVYWYLPKLFNALHDREAGVYSGALAADLLLLDDFGTQYDSDWAASRFDALVEERNSESGAVAVTTNVPLKDLAQNLKWWRAVDRWKDHGIALETATKSQRKPL